MKIMKFNRNLSGQDKILRIGLGLACIYLGFFENTFIQSPILSYLIAGFGVANILFSAIGACPIYWLAGINTYINSQTSNTTLKLRNKLLLIFTLVAFTIVTIFGILSYQIAKDFSVKEEIFLWEKFNRQKASAIARLEVTDNFTANETSEFILMDKNLNLLMSPPEIVSETQFNSLINIIKKSNSPSGLNKIEGVNLIWALTTVPGIDNKLLVIHNAVNEDDSNFNLAKAFLMAAFVLQWFSIWGALILSSFVSKRLSKQNDLIIYQSLHDGLTGLPNRRLLLDKLKGEIKKYNETNNSLYLLIFDLDRFKDINDMLGHRNGDRLLRKFSKRLTECLKSDEIMARLEGNEFTILCSSHNNNQHVNDNEKNISDYVNLVLDAMDKPFVLDNFDIQCDVSIGVSVFPDHSKEPLTLVRQAEVAMYQSKDRNQDYIVYSPEFDTSSVKQLTVISELKQAIANEELCLYYQPKIDIKSGQTVSLEALIRWNHPEKGLQFPDTFIPQAEQTGLIKPLTLWTLKEAIKQSHYWEKAGVLLPIAVNFSQRLLSHHHLVDDIESILKEYKMSPEYLELEITESAIMADASGAINMMKKINALGIPLSIDDFGTGYTSLSQLKDLPVSTLKIDKSFVLNLTESKHDATIVNSIIHLAHNMGQKVVAEGIENIESWNELQKMGCDIGQGYYMARPMPADKVEEWLKESQWPMKK